MALNDINEYILFCHRNSYLEEDIVREWAFQVAQW